MTYLKSFSITVLSILFICNISNAELCARLKSVSAGETHTLALADNNTLWACGDNSLWQLGLGSIEPTTIEEIVDWLDEIWQSGELTMSEDEYLRFRSVLQESTE
jgi:hypothetical protein